MRKIIPIILLAAMALSLTACHHNETAAAPEASPSPTPSQDELAILAASDTDAAAAVQSHVPPASSTDLQVDGAAYEKAMDCVGLTIFDLYAAIGKPIETPVYAPSATQEGVQEGTLVYMGFSVTTERTDTEELVRAVNVAGG